MGQIYIHLNEFIYICDFNAVHFESSANNNAYYERIWHYQMWNKTQIKTFEETELRQRREEREQKINPILKWFKYCLMRN